MNVLNLITNTNYFVASLDLLIHEYCRYLNTFVLKYLYKPSAPVINSVYTLNLIAYKV